MRKIKIISGFIVLAFSALLISASNDGYYFKVNKSFEIFGEVFRQIAANYVDEIDPEVLIDHGINGMLLRLDPYTSYYTEKDAEDIDILTNGTYTGFGITVGTVDSLLTITGVREGYPAQRSGIRIGDRIYKIDSIVVLRSNSGELRQYTRGAPGEKSEIHILRDGLDDTLHFFITREKIKINNVSVAQVINDSIAYIKLERFSRNSSEELSSALNKLRHEAKISGLILDLRNNPGGLLEAAVDVSELFVPRGSLIVSTKGRKPRNNYSYRSRTHPKEPTLPLAVIINENSASASEIVAGAIQDLDRGVILGRRSFGKGLVQSVVDLPYKSNLKLTTARYYTPSGRCIQKMDYTKLHSEYGKASRMRGDSVFYTEAGRPVRESTGILPDTIVADHDYPGYIKQLFRRHVIFNFANVKSAHFDDIPEIVNNEAELMNEFEKYLDKSNYSYQSKIGEYLDKIGKLADGNDMSSDTRDLIRKLEKKIRAEEKNMLGKHHDELVKLLAMEIKSRFVSDVEMQEESIFEDNCVMTASELLSSKKYRELLTAEPDGTDSGKNN